MALSDDCNTMSTLVPERVMWPTVELDELMRKSLHINFWYSSVASFSTGVKSYVGAKSLVNDVNDNEKIGPSLKCLYHMRT